MMSSPSSCYSEEAQAESQELFDSFMELAKQQENLQYAEESLQSKSNEEANMDVNLQCMSNRATEAGKVLSETKHTMEGEDLLCYVKEVSEMERIYQLHGDSDVEKESVMKPSINIGQQGRKDSNAPYNVQLPSKDELNITKRLSKAVDELSDLEKQLSLMITATGSCNSPIEQVKCKTGESSEQNVHDQSVPCLGHMSSSKINTEVFKTEALCTTCKASLDGIDASANDHNSPIDTKHITETVPSDSSSQVESAEIAPDIWELHNDRSIKIETEDEISGLSGNTENKAVKGDDEPCEKIGHNTFWQKPTGKCYKVSSSSFVDKPQNPAEDYYPSDMQINKVTANTFENDLKECDNQISINKFHKSAVAKTIEGNAGVQCCTLSKDLQSDKEKLLKPQAEDEEGHQNIPHEIEILMTDEMGLSQHESLEFLDVKQECEIFQDSQVLTDEEIESDASSTGGFDDNDNQFGYPFDLGNKDSHLQVEGHRVGSNLSTLQDKEFRNIGVIKDEKSEPGNVIIKGHLMKLGGSGLTPRNWRKRWFVLKEDNCLYYYKHSKDKVPCGVIVLCNYSVTKAPDSTKNYCFKLNKGGARTYHLCAEDDVVMKEWMLALMKAASAVSATGPSFQISEGNVHNVSLPALSIKDPDCHGYLSKQGQGTKSWKRRYCVLKNGYLYYYSDMANTTAIGVAKLLGYQIKSGESRGRLFCFYGSPPIKSMRVYNFAAETENDRERWMKRMEESIMRGNMSS